MQDTITSLANWIGVGIKLPGSFNSLTGGLSLNTGSDRINQSIYQILSCSKGERFFLPEFGSDLDKCVFEQDDSVLRSRLQLVIAEALQKWEPRIQVLSIDPILDQEDNTVPVVINYKIKGTNMTGNYVYPFSTQVMELGDVSHA